MYVARTFPLAATKQVTSAEVLLHEQVEHREAEVETAVYRLSSQMDRWAQLSQNLLAAGFVAEHLGSALVLQGCCWHYVDCVYHRKNAVQAAVQLEEGTLQGDWEQKKLLQHHPGLQTL